MKNETHDRKLNYCVVIPTYNNAKTLKSVIDKVAQHAPAIIIVDDGSTDGTGDVLSAYTEFKVITHATNQGKGMALRNAFQQANAQGYDYAITIDSDGQHDPDDIPKMVETINANYGKLVMGSRNMGQEGIPKKSSFGNKFSNFWFWAETGIRLSDTQTGFRAYPLKNIKGKKWFTKRFEFEIEVIVRLAWRNVKFCEQPINVQYLEDRVSHFRPFNDFSRISVLNTVLFSLAMLFFLPRLIFWNFSLKNLWKQVKGEFANTKNQPVKLAGSVGLGLFFGIFPIWGFQMAIAFTFASIFRLNRIIVLFCSNISIPPMIPVIIYLCFQFGALFVEERVELFSFSDISLATIQLQFTQYMIGAGLLATTLGLLGFVVTYLLTKLIVNKEEE